MEKKYQVFISSTYEDLKEERQEVVESVLNAGHIPAGMELFKAGPTQEETIKEWIEESDIYILLLGPRYGSIKESDSISYTEWEYNLAKELKKPMFSIVLSENYMENMVRDSRIKATKMETSKEEYIKFKQKVMKSLVKIIDHTAEIRSGISDSIRDIERKNSDQLEGWIKGSYLIELNNLKEENKDLSRKLVVRQDQVIEMQEDNIFKDNYIGDCKYEYVRECLSKKTIDVSSLQIEIEKTTSDKVSEKLNEYLEERLSSLDYFYSFKEKFFSGGISMSRQTIEDEIFNNQIVSIWVQFSLVDKETIKNKIGNGLVISSFDKITLSEPGRKFINIYETEKLNK